MQIIRKNDITISKNFMVLYYYTVSYMAVMSLYSGHQVFQALAVSLLWRANK